MLTVFETIKDVAIKIDHAIKTEDLGYSDSENSSGEDHPGGRGVGVPPASS